MSSNNAIGTTPTASLSDSSFTQGRWAEFAMSQTTYVHAPPPLSSSDTHINDIDFDNGYEPQSLDANCLEDIRAMTKSMHDLMNAADLPERPNSVSTSNGDSNLKNGNIGAKKNTKYGGSATEVSAPRNGSPGLKSGVRLSVRNGKSVVAPKPTRKSQNFGSGGKINATKKPAVPKTTRFGSSDGSAISDNGVSRRQKISGKKEQSLNNKLPKHVINRSVDTVDFGEGSRWSSDNDIETSDSFVNIQFAKRAYSQNSESSQSVESTDSFENVQFMQFNTTNNSYETNASYQNVEKNESNPLTKKTVRNSAKIDPATRPTTISKSAKKLQNTIESEKSAKSNGSTSKKTEQLSTVVKRREKKSTSHVSNSTDELNSARIETTRNKRYSCHIPQTARRAQESKCVDEKMSFDPSAKSKKFSSTDELNETKNKQSSNKTKRYSLYYTPQPTRKNYSGELNDLKNEKKLLNESISQLESRKPEFAASVRKDPKNRKSVLLTTTAASRNRSNKQNVHIKPETAKACSLTPAK